MMKLQYLLIYFLFTLSGSFVFAQTPEQSLPEKIFMIMRDSTTSLDVVFLQGQGGSISADGENVRYFNYFIENKVARKTKSQPSGTIMWLINGREFLSGNYFLGDSTGYIVLQKDGKEYVNELNGPGNAFLKSQFKK